MTQEEQLSDPKWWFDTIVMPNFEEYSSDVLCRRKAVNAIVTTYHFWERLYHFQRQQSSPPIIHTPKNEKKFRNSLIQDRPNLGVLRDVADAVKHQLRQREPDTTNPNGDLLSASSTGVTVSAMGGLYIDDTGLSVEGVLRDVIAFWRNKLEPMS